MKAKNILTGLTILILVLSFFYNPAPVQAADCTWNGGSGNWNDPANWSGCGGNVPGTNDTAVISSGTVTLDITTTVSGLTMSGGELVSSGHTLTVSDNLLLTGESNKLFAGMTLNNGGTAVWNGGTLTLGPWPNPVNFNNLVGATFEIVGGRNTLHSGGSAILNNGAIIKSGPGLSDITAALSVRNDGLIRVEEGQLRINGTRTIPVQVFTHTGDFVILAGATVEFDGTQNFGPTASITGDGHVSFIQSGSGYVLDYDMVYSIGGRTTLHCFSCVVRFHAQAVTGELALIPWYVGIFPGYPQIEGEGSITVTGQTLWHQGVIGHTGNYWNNGPITVEMQGGLALYGLSSQIMHDAIIRNHGEAVYTEGSFFIRHPNARFENLPGATFTIQGSRDFNYYWGGQDLPLGRLVNQGSLIKTGSGEATITSLIVENSGLIDIQEGSLAFQRRSGSTNVNGGARLILDGGQVQSSTPLVFTDYARLQGSGTIHAGVQAAEEIAPGFTTTPWTPGLITIHGDLAMGTDARLRARLISGPTPGSGYDQLAVTGQAQVAGGLEVRLADGYTPPFGAEFDLLTCTLGCNGSFDMFEFHPSAEDYEVFTMPNQVSVRWVGESNSQHLVFLPLVTR